MKQVWGQSRDGLCLKTTLYIQYLQATPTYIFLCVVYNLHAMTKHSYPNAQFFSLNTTCMDMYVCVAYGCWTFGCS